MDTLQPIIKLNRDLLKAFTAEHPGGVTTNEARYLVDMYYNVQKMRIRPGLQVKALERDAIKAGNEPESHTALDRFASDFSIHEDNIRKILNWYVQAHPMAWFFENTLGVGPVLAAGLLAHIDITKCPTVGHIWTFAGLNPETKWDKGEKRPWNTQLKTICWKIGESFIKQSGHAGAFYASFYKERKARDWQKNLAGELVAAAKANMAIKKYSKDTDQYAWYTGQIDPQKARASLEAGKTPSAMSCRGEGGFPMLSPAHINARARRYAVKLFLSHLHHCWYLTHYGEEPPKPFAISILDHAHYIAPPQLQFRQSLAA